MKLLKNPSIVVTSNHPIISLDRIMDYTGSSYKGDMKNDKMEGEGEYVFPSGTKYIGSFKDGQFDGKGTLHFKNGMIRISIY